MMGSGAARMLALGALALGALGFAAPAAAQDDYPNKTVTLVVPYPPGGGVDVLARGRGKTLRCARPSGDRRQSRRRLWPRRHARGDPQRAGRLHAVPRPHRLDLDQPESLR